MGERLCPLKTQGAGEDVTTGIDGCFDGKLYFRSPRRSLNKCALICPALMRCVPRSCTPSHLSQCTRMALLTREAYSGLVTGGGSTHMLGREPNAETTADSGKSADTSICAMLCMFQRAGARTCRCWLWWCRGLQIVLGLVLRSVFGTGSGRHHLHRTLQTHNTTNRAIDGVTRSSARSLSGMQCHTYFGPDPEGMLCSTSIAVFLLATETI